jgi:hypothetical protein
LAKIDFAFAAVKMSRGLAFWGLAAYNFAFRSRTVSKLRLRVLRSLRLWAWDDSRQLLIRVSAYVEL